MKRFRIQGLLIAVLLITGHGLWAQGPLAPPGAPAPTMKTLDQTEPRWEINASNTPGDLGALFRITQAGSYYLSATVTGTASKGGIVIAANDVTLDLKGFALIGVPGSLAGIGSSGLPANLSVRNGAVRGWGGTGVDLISTKQVRLERLRVSDNGGAGLRIGENGSLQECTATGNTTTGIVAEIGGIIRGCVSRGNGATGIYAGQESLVTDCVAQQNGGAGIEVSMLGIVDGCVARENGGHGIATPLASIVRRCIANHNASNGIAAVSCYVQRNNVNNNQNGISASGGLTVDNQCIGNFPGAGILSSSYLFRNFCNGNGTNYSDNGTCLAITNSCPAAVSNPWNNFY